MENDFFQLYTQHSLLALEVGHNSVADWRLAVYDKKDKDLGDYGDPVVLVTGTDPKLVFAKGYADLCEYLLKTRDGY